jgi:hypothetical protein
MTGWHAGGTAPDSTALTDQVRACHDDCQRYLAAAAAAPHQPDALAMQRAMLDRLVDAAGVIGRCSLLLLQLEIEAQRG